MVGKEEAMGRRKIEFGPKIPEADPLPETERPRLLARISVNLHISRDEDLDAAIDESLADLGRFARADRSYLFQYDYERSTMTNTHEWCAEGIEPQIQSLRDLPMAAFDWAVRALERDEILSIPNVEELPEEAVAERETLQAQDIRSLILVAYKGSEDKPLGFLGFDSVTALRRWGEDDRYLLMVVGEMLGATLEQIGKQRAMREGMATTRAILNAIPDMIFVIDREGIIRTHHTQGKGELAIGEREVIGSSTWDVIGPEWHDSLRDAIDEALSSGTTHPVEYSLDLPSGRTGYYEARFARLDADHVLALIRNITSRRRSEDSLKWHASQLAIVEENQRRDLAFQLHDGVSQDLAAAAIKLQQMISMPSDPASDGLREIDGLIQKAIRHSRELTRSLSPPVLYELGICPALSSLAATLSERSGIAIVAETPEPPLPLEQSLSIHLYRIARELLINAIKHSGTDSIRLALEQDGGAVVLTVADRGRGFEDGLLPDDSKRPGSGFGLFSIRRRLEPLGGVLEIRNEGGAAVRVRIPLQTDSQMNSRKP